MKKSLDQFDWGDTDQEYIQLFTNENLVFNTYEQHCPVKTGDIVFDIGANCGSFTYSILDKNPKHVYCVEPSNTLIHSLRNNVGDGPVTLINKAIGDENCENKTIAENGIFIYQNDGDVYSTITLKQLIKENNISKIDFLKFDCEGGEYSIFTKENYNFIKNHVVHFAGEWHINDHENSIERFIEFRNLYLQDYKELYVYDRTGKEITQDIFNDEFLYHFREYWKETYIGQFIIYVTYEQNKLTNFPPVYYVSLSDSTDRQQAFEKQFLLNGIENVKMIEAYDGRKDDYRYKPDIVDGLHFETLDSGGIAVTISHLKAIIEWYNNSDSDYAIFFEDDMTIESANDWNFTWDEFISSLPENWKAIQLSLIKDGITQDDMKLNQRVWWNWSAGSYLIKRNYAKELIEHFYQNEKFYLKIKGEDNTIPCIEHCLFALGIGYVYTIPLFYENINFVSTFYQHFIQKTHKDLQIDSSNYVKYWWKIAGLNKSLDDLMLMYNHNTIPHIEEKLKNFPSVNFISIEESEDRRKVLYQQFEKYGITDITPHIYKKYRDEDHKIIEGPLVNHNGKGPVTSHLKAIKEWYENTDEPYTFFCEDDLSLDTVKYWNFTWDEFFNSLPENWNIVQLCLIREDMFIFFNPEVKFRHRFLCDWSACAYLITRKHAENLIKNYYPDDYIHLEYKGTDKEFRENEYSSFWFLLPQVENMVYSSFGGGNFVFPLFVENIFEPTWRNDENWINRKCRNEILEWWDLKGSNKTLNDLML
jgi:FkbM family methyltransferase